MKSSFQKICSFLLIFSFVFALSGITASQPTHAQTNAEIIAACGPNSPKKFQIGTPDYVRCAEEFRAQFQNGTPGTNTNANEGGVFSKLLILLTPAKWILGAIGAVSIVILKIASLLTYLSGIVLNYVVWYTVVAMKEHLGTAGAIDDAWRVIRDVSNMAFIFILLYAAIQQILGIGKDVKGLIVRIIVVAVLINFSLFFTKFVIDISNLLALTFYDAIAPGALSSSFSTGLSTSLMESLKINTIWNTAGFADADLLVIGVMGTIVSLIAAFVFFAISILFVIRFVVLIFVLVLSPIAFIAFILPQAEKYRDQWKDALIGQAFFAPIYFMLTWIVIMLSRKLFITTNGTMASAIIGVNQNGTSTHDPSSIGILVNFIIMIAMLIASLTVAKEWASKVPGGMNKLIGSAMGAAGGATLGIAGTFGRKTIGSWGGNTVSDEDLKARARQGDMGARLKLAVAGKASKASFDMRATGIGGTLGAGKAQKGGWSQDQKDAAKRFEAYKPSGDSIKAAKEEEARHEKAIREAAETAESKTVDHLEAERSLKEARKASTRGFNPEQFKARSEQLKVLQEQVEAHKEERTERIKTYSTTAPELADARNAHAESKEKRQNLEGTLEKMAKASENREPTLRAKIPFTKIGFAIPGSGYIIGGKDRAAAIRAAAKGKSNKEKLAEAAAAVAKEDAPAEEEKPREDAGEEKKT